MTPGVADSSSPAAVLDERSRYLRTLVVDALEGGGRGHVGAALSLIEILRVLYDDVLKVRPAEPRWPDRDRLILSKGHGCLALYALLADKGFVSMDELRRQCRPGALLGGHPEIRIPGVEASTGALGHGLAIGVGLALAARLQKRPSRVFVVMGDGESNEGSVWEAALMAAKHRLASLTVVLDYNKMQSYGPVPEVLPLEPLADKFRAFGFAVAEADGHDVADLRQTFRKLPLHADKPGAVICHTVKGRGIAVCEHNASWHHKARLPADQAEALRRELLGG
jgi:transketolase